MRPLPERHSGARRLSGYDEIRSALEDDWFGAFPLEEWEIEVEELIDHGDQVVAIARQRGRGANSGVAVNLEQVHIATLRDGQIARLDSYLDTWRRSALNSGPRSDPGV